MAEYGSFSEVRARLDEIVTEVRKRDLSLEKSLDLYEEAIKLGNRAAELVDKPEFSEDELAAASAEDTPQGEEPLDPPRWAGRGGRPARRVDGRAACPAPRDRL